jgi:hypothetical protein
MDSLASTTTDGKMAVQMAKFINFRNAKYGTIQECYWDDEIDSVLIPDEFLDEERIQEVLNACTAEAWAHVYANRDKYSPRIRDMIEPKNVWSGKRKMVVREMTDDDMVRLEREARSAKKAVFDTEAWPSIKADIPERPQEEVDDDADYAWEALTKAKQRMTDFIAKKKNRYVPPSVRKTVDPEQQEIEDDIEQCEKEFEEAEKRILEADELYWSQKQNECFQEWLCEM